MDISRAYLFWHAAFFFVYWEVQVWVTKCASQLGGFCQYSNGYEFEWGTP